MALYVFSKTRVDVCIPFAEKEEEYVVYVIKVSLGEVWWLTKHRYSSFDNLHQQLVQRFVPRGVCARHLERLLVFRMDGVRPVVGLGLGF